MIYTTTFINSLVYPRFSFGMATALLVARYFNVRSWLSERGYNRAMLTDEVQLWLLKVAVLTSIVSSIRLVIRK